MINRPKPLLCVEHIEKYYGNQGSVTKALNQVSFCVQHGEFVSIMGASGSGKTTLLNCISTIDTVSAGHILLDGKDITTISEDDISAFRRDNLGFVFQDFNLLDTLSVKDNIFLPLVLGRLPYQEMEQRLQPLAKKLHIESLLDKRPFELSGGQKQRVAIARSLITKPQLLLADEPTAALDYKNSEDILKLFEEINADGQTLLMVTHSANAASHAKRVLFIKDGRIFHQIYRGHKTNQEFAKDISLTMSALLGGQ